MAMMSTLNSSSKSIKEKRHWKWMNETFICIASTKVHLRYQIKFSGLMLYVIILIFPLISKSQCKSLVDCIFPFNRFRNKGNYLLTYRSYWVCVGKIASIFFYDFMWTKHLDNGLFRFIDCDFADELRHQFGLKLW